MIAVAGDGVAQLAVRPLIGVLVAALIVSEPRRRPLLIAAACSTMLVSAAVLHGQPVPASVGLCALVGGEAVAIAWLIRRTIDGPFALDRVSHTGALIVWSTLVPMAGGALGASLSLLGDLPLSTAWRSWWLAHALGILLAAPLGVAALSDRAAFARLARPGKALEAVLVFTGGTLVAATIFGEAVDPLLRVPAYVLPFLLWAAFRFGPAGAAAAIFIVSFIGLWNAAQGQGPLALAGATAANQVLRSQGSATIAAVSILFLASVVAERKRVAQEIAVLLAALQKAHAEVKTLQGLIPMCAWCHKVRDDAGFWQQIEAYLDARVDATFSHSICPACTERARDEIASHATNAGI